MSGAGVAETEYTAFAHKKGQAVTARLIVRRVRDLNKKAAAGQDELFPAWRHHAVFTNSPFGFQAEGQHRDHAVVEQVFADVTSGPPAHMPSGSSPRMPPGLPTSLQLFQQAIRPARSRVAAARRRRDSVPGYLVLH